MKKISTRPFQWETHHNLYAGLLIIFAVMIMLSFVGCGGDQQASTAEATTEEVAEEAADDGAMSLTEEDIAALKDKFIFDEERGYYYHKHWNRSWPKRRTLTADVNQTGYFYVCSNFYGNKGIKHDKIKIKIGEEELESEAVNLKEANEHRTEKEGANVFEVNYYTNYRDKGIFDAIAKSSGDVKISFIGSRSTTEYEDLPKSDIVALKECHQLSLILRVTGGQ